MVKLSEIANGREGSSVTIRPVHARLSDDMRYYRTLRQLVSNIYKFTVDNIVSEYLSEQAKGQLLDADIKDVSRSTFDQLKAAAGIWALTSERGVDNILNQAGDRHTMAFNAAVKSAVGVDTSAILNKEGIAGIVRAQSQFSASLITNLSDDFISKIESTVYQAALQGTSVKDLTAQLAKLRGVTDRRAKLIATDQMQKFNGNLNKARQEELGITEYEWITVGDSKVRDDHASRSGKTFRWDEPPEDGHPGQAVRCRCTAGAIVSF